MINETIRMVPPRSSEKPKAALAGLAGVLLLVGSGATFALWNDEARLDREQIELGQLSVRAEDFTWYDVSRDVSGHDVETVSNWQNAIEGVRIDPNSFRLVPGDLLFATGQIRSNLVGETLIAELGIEGQFDDETGDNLLPDWFTLDVQFIDPETGEFVESITQTPDSPTVTVRMLVGFPRETTDRMSLPGGPSHSVDLSALRVTLQQVVS